MARIMLVDDDPGVLCALQVALHAAGNEVRQADGLEAALQLASEYLPDLIVVEIMMPDGTDGLQLVWKSRESEAEELRSVPILMAAGLHEHTELRLFPEHSNGTYQPGEALPIQGRLDKPAQLLAAIADLVHE